MDRLAKETGGVAHYGGNDFKAFLTEDIDNGSRFYTIAYTPNNNREVGKERHIEIKTVSGDYKLAYRRSYFEDTTKQAKAAAARILGIGVRRLIRSFPIRAAGRWSAARTRWPNGRSFGRSKGRIRRGAGRRSDRRRVRGRR